MKDYELSVLFHPDLEMNLDPAILKVRKAVEASGGKIVKEESDGKKHTAYPVKGNEYALYYYFDVELPKDAPAKISSTLEITDEVVRYLLVTTDPRRIKYLASLQAKAEGAEAEKVEETTKEEKEA